MDTGESRRQLVIVSHPGRRSGGGWGSASCMQPVAPLGVLSRLLGGVLGNLPAFFFRNKQPGGCHDDAERQPALAPAIGVHFYIQ